MKWFKKKSQSVDADYPIRHDPLQDRPRPTGAVEWISKLPAPLLERIFSFICPHANDETYETCEQSAVEDSCMLCDLRDLAHCAQTSRRWRKLASNVLYHSIRIDAVHYCDREDTLAERRKRRSFINRNADPEDTPQVRVQLLSRTLREDHAGLSLKVQFLKTPYMTRETSKPDLARIAAVAPNLRYLDLPEGVFTDDPSCNTLKHEIQGRCPDLRKMSYMGGSERSLELLTRGLWRNLEVLELANLNMDPTILRHVLGSLPRLRALKVSDMKAFNDQLFQHNDYLPPWPVLNELIFSNVPNVTAEGLVAYLFRSDTQDSLKTLSLTATGVHPSTLQQIVATAPRLTHLSIIEAVTTSFPVGIPPLCSPSLDTLHYEITSASSANSYTNTTASYYAYLTTSLISNGLPSLRKLYVRDPDFPESLLDLAPPAPAFAFDPDVLPPPRMQPVSAGSSHLSPYSTGTSSFPPPQRFSSNNPFLPALSGPGLKQPLEVFSKGLDEMEWSFSHVQPAGRDRRASATAPRPVSTSGLDYGTRWAAGVGGGARKSVIVGNGFGGFLAVPADDAGRPRSAGGERGRKRVSQYDMWR